MSLIREHLCIATSYCVIFGSAPHRRRRSICVGCRSYAEAIVRWPTLKDRGKYGYNKTLMYDSTYISRVESVIEGALSSMDLKGMVENSNGKWVLNNPLQRQGQGGSLTRVMIPPSHKNAIRIARGSCLPAYPRIPDSFELSSTSSLSSDMGNGRDR
jgi:hypothetical protein